MRDEQGWDRQGWLKSQRLSSQLMPRAKLELRTGKIVGVRKSEVWAEQVPEVEVTSLP
jgi:hypothetical protein